ncbi:MAG: DUF1015 domain-containing protein, partial [Candidatus Hydrothermarchaeaceae archaeon]
RLILGEKYEGDTPENNSYTRARAYFNKWLEEGVLKKDERPSIYVLEQEYSVDNERKKMLGIISLVKLEEFEKGVILPHEETLAEAIDDRLNLMSTCSANFSQIFSMYSDPEGIVEKIIAKETRKSPVAEVDANGILNRLWKIDDSDIIASVKAGMKEKKLFIADGHHRYATALIMRDRMREKTGSNAYDYTMMYYTNMDSGGITILPAHRLLSNVNFDMSKMQKIEEYFDVDSVEQEQMLKKLKEMNRGHHVFGMCFDSKCYLLTLKDENVMDKIIDSEKSKEWKRLDVTIIHALLIDLIVDHDNLSYIIDDKEAMRTAEEKGNVVLFVNPTKLDEVKNIALNREKMPGKATYFYPKLLTGFVLNKID